VSPAEAQQLHVSVAQLRQCGRVIGHLHHERKLLRLTTLGLFGAVVLKIDCLHLLGKLLTMERHQKKPE
jgi:hypothetical protein